MTKLHFSGHESFICKQFWLKKGVDFIRSEGSFSAKEAVVGLGVGKNMVRAIRYWLRAFGIINSETDELTNIGRKIFVDERGDQYLESIGTVWLLHYLLVKMGHATLYSLVFNEFRRLRPEFKTEQLISWVKRYCAEQEQSGYNKNTVTRDVRTLLNNYLSPSFTKKSDVEDNFSGLLFELRLVGVKRKIDILNDQEVDYFSIEPSHRDTLPAEIALYTIIDYLDGRRTVTLQDLYHGHNAPGSIFALSQDGLYQKIQEIIDLDLGLSYSETAGNQVLQIPTSFTHDKLSILDVYFN
jgi:hypothetical protein